jgi:KDO2-lipid IV(A) lauroyltransferase
MDIVYLFSPVLKFLLQYIPSYRRSVIYENLRNSLVYEDDTTIRTIQSSYYSHLSEIILENLKLFSGSKQSSMKFDMVNPEILTNAFTNNQDIIVVSGHLGNWELGFSEAAQYFQHTLCGIYKEQSNQEFDQYLHDLRAHRGLELIKESRFIKTILSEHSTPRIFILIPDQNPRNNKSIRYFNFLNQRTPFSTSLEKIAHKYNLPVLYADIIKLKRGKYQAQLSWIFNGNEKGKKVNITEQYAKLLERNILSNPSIWLWSHRRWKQG